jgi:hypothetical protein
MRLVAAATAAHADEDFEGLLRVHPALLDTATPRRFYSAARLEGMAARVSWLEPDLRPLPPI